MKILFMQFGSKYYFDNNKYYTDGSLNEKIWNRYLNFSKKITVLGRKKNNFKQDKCIYTLNQVPDNVDVFLLDDIYNPKKNYFNIFLRRKNKKNIRKYIDDNDIIVIRSITNDYNLYAAKYCIKEKKDFIVEVTGFGFDSLWFYGGILGKIMAIIIEIKMKKIIRKCPNVLYVTNLALQKRYFNNNNNIGCSDVEIKIDEKSFKRKKERFKNIDLKSETLTIGTIGPVDTKLKGQQDVIKALYILKNKYGINNFKYSLVGRGNNKNLKNIVKKFDLQNNVVFDGEKGHNEIFEWLDTIDIYIQPSYQEGLCRALIEAMSRGCPIIASNAGGNFELVNKEFMFKKGNVKDLISKLNKMIVNKEILQNESIRSYNLAKQYESSKLDKKRKEFYKKVINGEIDD